MLKLVIGRLRVWGLGFMAFIVEFKCTYYEYWLFVPHTYQLISGIIFRPRLYGRHREWFLSHVRFSALMQMPYSFVQVWVRYPNVMIPGPPLTHALPALVAYLTRLHIIVVFSPCARKIGAVWKKSCIFCCFYSFLSLCVCVLMLFVSWGNSSLLMKLEIVEVKSVS